MSYWLWVATFSLSQCHRQAGEFISNTLGLAPELTSSSVALGWKTRLLLTRSEAYSCLLFSQGLEAKKKAGSNSAYTDILKVYKLSLSAEQAKIFIRLLSKTKDDFLVASAT